MSPANRAHNVPPAPIDPAPALCRSHSAASLSSTGSSVIYKRPHLSALCFEAYHATPAGKIDNTPAHLLPSPGIPLNYSGDAIFSAAKIVEGDLPNTVEQARNSIEASYWQEALQKEYDAQLEIKLGLWLIFLQIEGLLVVVVECRSGQWVESVT